jgi:hypothetical protein
MRNNGVLVVGDDEFHAALRMGLDRLAVRLGSKSRAAAALQMSPQNYAEVEKGTVPHVKRLFEALAHDETLLDDVATLYRRKIIPVDQDAQRAAPALVAALHKLIEAEQDGKITHDELLGMEFELRDAEKRICGLLQKIAEHRKPSLVRA